MRAAAPRLSQQSGHPLGYQSNTHGRTFSRLLLSGRWASMGTDKELRGKAWLVGCGPGSLDHLTLKVVRLIKSADVILYDDLGAEAAIEEFASGAAEQIYVGKRGGQKSIAQTEIDDLLVKHCRQVVRLKGGCPSVFSRCSSELHALAAAGCAAELVPGVSSALAAPLFAGMPCRMPPLLPFSAYVRATERMVKALKHRIKVQCATVRGFPLTDAQLGRGFAVTSGHQPEATDWAAFARIDTLVVLMAGRSLGVLMRLLRSAGWDAHKPVAVVRAAGQPDQAIWKGTVGTIVEQTEGTGPLSPCVLIIGEVVKLGELG